MVSRKALKHFLPYLLIVIVLAFTFNYSKIFINYDFDNYYGKLIDHKAYDFQLKDSDGKSVKLSDFEGEYIFLTFGFTKCAEVCPLNLMRFKQLHGLFKKNNISNINFLFISFDDLRDSPEDVKSFVDHFDTPNLYGLLSGKDSGLQVANKFKNHISVNDNMIRRDPAHQINHNGFLYLIDPNGYLKLIYMNENLDQMKVLNDLKGISKF